MHCWIPWFSSGQLSSISRGSNYDTNCKVQVQFERAWIALIMILIKFKIIFLKFKFTKLFRWLINFMSTKQVEENNQVREVLDQLNTNKIREKEEIANQEDFQISFNLKYNSTSDLLQFDEAKPKLYKGRCSLQLSLVRPKGFITDLVNSHETTLWIVHSQLKMYKHYQQHKEYNKS